MPDTMQLQGRVPSHVPPDLVRPFPYILGETTTLKPHSFIAEIHQGPAVFWAERVFMGVQGAWVPRRLDDVQAVYFDNEHYKARDFAPFSKLCGETWFLVPAEVDPPLHALLRAAVNPLFTPKKMAALEEKIRGYARDYILAFKQSGRCEFMSQFAFEFPIRVFLELMGLPQDRVEQFMIWEHKLLHEPDLNEIIRATREVNAYLAEQCEDRRINPRDDFITFGVQAEVEGRKMTCDELTGFCFNLFIGGLDTVSTNMSLQFWHLAEHHADQDFLRAQPDRIADAIEEMMRAYAAVATSRECIKQTTLGEVTVMPGDKVLMATFLAGRDPDAYENPEVVDFNRKPKHVSFGYGVHLCIGMHLARRELRIALEEFLDIIPTFSIEPGTEITSYMAAMIQPIALPLVWQG